MPGNIHRADKPTVNTKPEKPSRAQADDVLAALLSQHADLDSLVPENPMSVDRLQWEHIQRVLSEHDGNISATARALGMHRRTLQRKLQKRPVRR